MQGVPCEGLGEPVVGIQTICRMPVISKQEIAGEIIQVDRFGNLITNISRSQIEDWAKAKAVSHAKTTDQEELSHVASSDW